MDERIDRLETEVSNLKSDVKVNTIFIKDAKKILMGIFITVIVTLASTIIANTLSHDSLEHPHSVAVLRLMGSGKTGVDRSLRKLEERGYVKSSSPEEWALTKAGIAQARSLLNTREGNYNDH